MTIRAVLFDVDFTLARPGPELGAAGYVRVGALHGLALDAERYEEARRAAVDALQRHSDLRHDEQIWVEFTERVVRGMGGDAERASEAAAEIASAWERSENFDLYDDAMPVLETLRRHGLKIGLISNGVRDLDEFVRHHALDVDAAVGSRAHGKVKPDPTIFQAALALLEVEPKDAVMVGDSPEDDIAGARALGMRALLVDREGRYPGAEDRLPDLGSLPLVLGLP